MKWITLPLVVLSLSTVVCNNSGTAPAENITDSAALRDTGSLQDSIKGPDITAADTDLVDTAAYNKKMRFVANGDSSGRWPVKAPYPLKGALLPFNRVVAYYGNLYSSRMGILGELPKRQMLQKLAGEVSRWEKADPQTPAIPALHYIAVTAQGSAGKDGKYRLRMPFQQIDTIVKWAREIKGLAFIDVQIGLSTLQDELPRFDAYLKLPDVHLGIDPEFAMKNGAKPGTAIGSLSASDINYTIDLLAKLVRKHQLPPKMLVVHRFTNDMVMNYKMIKKVPEVQVIIDMDGWGEKELKANTWKRYIYQQPVQFAGFKIFYKNDLKGKSKGLYTPSELMKFKPMPLYIQYQ